MKRLLKYMKEYVRECILAPLFKLLEASFELLVPLVVASMIDVGIATNNQHLIIRSSLTLVGLAALGLVAATSAQYFSAKAATGFAAKLRHHLFDHISKLTYGQIDRQGTSTLITRMTSDVNQVQSGVNLFLRLFLRSPFIVAGAMVMAFYVNVRAAMIFAIVIPVLAVIVFGIMLYTMPLYKQVQKALDKVLLNTKENLAGVRVIRAFNQEDKETETFNTNHEQLTSLQEYVGRISNMMNPLTYVVINLGIVFILYSGALQIDAGILSQGEVVALLNYMSQILVELVKLANLIITLSKAMASASRIADVIDLVPDMKDGTEILTTDHEVAITFDDVGMYYPNAASPSLQHISFTLNKGQSLGIIGATGAGKSSLVALLGRFYDASEGQIQLFGQPIQNYRLDSLRSHIGYVAQKAQLFRGSIEDNLRWGDLDATNTTLKKALDISQASEFVLSKEEGLDHMVLQDGRNLSGGQRQRLTIARALTRQPDILILDDASSALDLATDAKLRSALQTLPETMTTIIVSQRPSSIMHCDLILVLDDGELVASGSHEALLENCGIYREIYDIQFGKAGV